MEESAKLSNVTRDWFHNDRAVILHDKAQAITGVDTEMLAYSFGIVTWPLVVNVAVGMLLLTLSYTSYLYVSRSVKRVPLLLD